MREVDENSAFQDTRVPDFDKKARNYALELGKNAAAYARGGYLGYVFAVFRHGTPYTLFRRLVARFSSVLFLARALRIALRVLLIAERSALLLLLLGLLFLLFPVFLVLSVLFAVITRVAQYRADRLYAHLFAEQRVVALFPVAGKVCTELFARDLSREYMLLIVGEFPQGVSLSPFSSARLMLPRCLCVREHYFFHLRRTLLRKSTFFAQIY